MPYRNSLASLAALLAMALPAVASEPPQITLIAAPDMAWATTPEGVAFAALKGDRFAGPYQAMVRLPAGVASPLHVKSADMFGVMIQGEMVHIVEGANKEDALRVGPGGFYNIPKGLAHISACVSDVPCVAYLYQNGAFDFVPVSQ